MAVLLITSGALVVARALATALVTKSNAADALRNWSRRTREARSCCADLSLFSFAVNQERTMHRGCNNSRGVFSKLSIIPRSTMWKWTSTDLEVLVHFHIVERGMMESLESLENIPHCGKFFRGLKRPCSLETLDNMPACESPCLYCTPHSPVVSLAIQLVIRDECLDSECLSG